MKLKNITLRRNKLLFAICGFVVLVLAVIIFEKIRYRVETNKKVAIIREYISNQSYIKFLEDETIGEGECYIPSSRSMICTEVSYNIADDNCDRVKLIFDEQENKRRTSDDLSGEHDKFKGRIIRPFVYLFDDSQGKSCFAEFTIK